MEVAEQLSDIVHCVPFLAALPQALLSDCMKLLQIRTYEKNSRLSDPAEVAFGVVLSGTLAAITTAKQGPETAAESPIRSKGGKKPLSQTYTERRRLKAGDSFGEAGWEASYFHCLELCSLATLSSSELGTVQQAFAQHQTLEKVAFFRSLPMFAGWSKSLLAKLCVYVKANRFTRNQFIYREGDPAVDVFFLVSGEVLVTAKLEFPANEPISRSLSPRKGRSPALQGKVCVKQPRELFGDEGSTTRPTSCICASNTALCYVMPRLDFEKRVMHPSTLQFLCAKREALDAWQRGRLLSLRNAETLKAQTVPEPDPPVQQSSDPPELQATRRKHDTKPSPPSHPSLFLTCQEASDSLQEPVTLSPELELKGAAETLRGLPELPATAMYRKSMSPRNFYATPRAAVLAKYRNRDLILRDYLSDSTSPILRPFSPSQTMSIVLPKVLRRSRHNMFRLTLPK